jgi:nickel/cobalt exporter
MHDQHGQHHHHAEVQDTAEDETLQKLLILLDHWIEHEGSHAEEYKAWAAKADAAGEQEVAREVHLAIEGGESVRGHLKRARSVLAAKLVLKRHGR